MELETGELYRITNCHRQAGSTTKHSPSNPMQVLVIYETSMWNKRLLLPQEWLEMYASMWWISWGRLQHSTHKFALTKKLFWLNEKEVSAHCFCCNFLVVQLLQKKK